MIQRTSIISLGCVVLIGIHLIGSQVWLTPISPPSPGFNQVDNQIKAQPQDTGSNSNQLWENLDPNDISFLETTIKVHKQLPLKYGLYRLNFPELKAILQNISHQSSFLEPDHRLSATSDHLTKIPIPLPDGSLAQFAIYETQIMEPVLAAQFSEIRSYVGECLGRPSTNLRLTLTPKGIYATVLADNYNLITIEPYWNQNQICYLSSFDNDRPDIQTNFDCWVTPEMEEFAYLNGFTPNLTSLRQNQTISLPQHRIFRLAIATTGEFYQSTSTWSNSTTGFSGNTNTDVMAKIVYFVSIANQVFGRELSIEFILSTGIENLWFTDPQTDPYSGDLLSRAEQNQRTLDRVLGNQNYDIGHLFDQPGSLNNGGIGFIGGVCTTGYKGQGVTATANNMTFVHELGHQLGALHTFNSQAGDCKTSRNTLACFEIGSGSTIMSYAGRCSPEVVQNKRDMYFHGDSLSRILSRLLSPPPQLATDCSVKTTLPESVLTVDAGLNYAIPRKTPFALKATGGDTNPLPGSELVYCWEEFDLGAASPPQTGTGMQPIFRSYPPTEDSVRTFPNLTDLLQNNNRFGETLPQVMRTLNFRCTVRNGLGNFAFDTMKVSVINTPDAFAITKPNSALVWKSGSTQTVTWNVNKTNLNPIKCTQVRILLSVDGGLTYTVLVETTPNDGNQLVVLPSGTTTTRARIKVEAIGNIFFDVSNVDFKIIS